MLTLYLKYNQIKSKINKEISKWIQSFEWMRACVCVGGCAYLLLMVVAECRLRGRGAVPPRPGLLHTRESVLWRRQEPMRSQYNFFWTRVSHFLIVFFFLLCLLQTRCFVNLTAVEPGPSSPQNYTNTQQWHHLTYVEDPQVPQPAATHASVDD